MTLASAGEAECAACSRQRQRVPARHQLVRTTLSSTGWELSRTQPLVLRDGRTVPHTVLSTTGWGGNCPAHSSNVLRDGGTVPHTQLVRDGVAPSRTHSL